MGHRARKKTKNRRQRAEDGRQCVGGREELRRDEWTEKNEEGWVDGWTEKIRGRKRMMRMDDWTRTLRMKEKIRD